MNFFARVQEQKIIEETFLGDVYTQFLKTILRSDAQNIFLDIYLILDMLIYRQMYTILRYINKNTINIYVFFLGIKQFCDANYCPKIGKLFSWLRTNFVRDLNLSFLGCSFHCLIQISVYINMDKTNALLLKNIALPDFTICTRRGTLK